jgi:hypothetical protein
MESAALIDSDNKDEQMQRVNVRLLPVPRALMRFQRFNLGEYGCQCGRYSDTRKLSDRTGVASDPRNRDNKQVLLR